MPGSTPPSRAGTACSWPRAPTAWRPCWWPPAAAAEAVAPAEQAVALYQELAGANPGRYVSELEAAVKLRGTLAAQG